MNRFLLILFFLLPALAHGAEHPVCPKLPNHPAIRWDSSLESILSNTFWLCHAKNDAGQTVLSAIATSEIGNPTYGANFRTITTFHGRSFVWFSDRDEAGESQNIARSYLSTGNSKFPLMMVWFKFNDPDDFNRKAGLVSLLELP